MKNINNINIANKLLFFLSCDETQKITFKPLFGGTGVSFSGVMFAWIYEEYLFLKANHHDLSRFIELKMSPMHFNTGRYVKLLQYYKVTSELWHNITVLKALIKQVINSALKFEEEKNKLREPRLKDLPNMSLSLERSLIKIGINNIFDLKSQGIYYCFYELKKRNKNMAINVLYNLYCALKNIHVATLTLEKKQELKQNYNEYFTLNQKDIINTTS